MEERDDDTAQTAREAVEARRFSDSPVEALRVQRDAYAASGWEAAAIYDNLRDELVVAKQRLSDQEKELPARICRGRLDHITRPAKDGVPLDEADPQSAIPAAEPSSVS